jgi:hypothetical protein
MRPRKTRKVRKARQQRGGSLEERFPSISFTLQTPFAEAGKKVNNAPIKPNLDTWSIEERALFHKKHLLTMYETKGNGERVNLCTLYFTPSFEGSGLGYLNQLDCSKIKTNTFRPVSYLIVYKFLEILQSLEIPFVFFSVAAAGEKYYRLFELYHSMGFVCKPDASTLSENATEILTQYKAQQVNNEGFFRALSSRNLAHKNTAMNMFMRCSEMYGHVPSVLAKIESQFPSPE